MEHGKKYNKIIFDLGTGDGRFVYKNALKNPQNLYIGVDPAEKQMEIFQRKVNRKKLDNARFLTGSIETLPDLEQEVDEIYIILPWGSLLKHIVRPAQNEIKNLSGLLKKGGRIFILLGYSQDLEPNETERLDIPDINEKYIKSIIAPKMNKYGGLEMHTCQKLNNEDLKNFETTWSKRLGFGKDRDMYFINFEKIL